MVEKDTENQLPEGHAGEPHLPSMVTEPYKGQGVTASVLSRGGFGGLVGYFFGNWVGNLGDRPFGNTKRLGLSARFWQIFFGGAFALIGASTAAREARESKYQHIKLQNGLKKLYTAHTELKAQHETLLSETQVKAERDETDKIAEADRPGRPDKAPHTTILAAEAVLDGAKQTAMAR